ncbi:MAG TPA: DUF6766 family protein [Longimicrobiales bacterium]
MKRFLHDNGLSIVNFTLFAVFLGATSLTGHRYYNDEQQDHGEPPVTYAEYVGSGDFLEAVMENWESEFLQMAMYVILTTMLFQKGSSESKDPDRRDKVDRDPRRTKHGPDTPWPVRRGGWVSRLYEHSLSLAFALIFLLSFLLHARGGALAESEEQLQHGGEVVTTLQYMGSSRFWFESFQNWQSEFLAVFAIVFLSIFLRQRASPESKPVDEPHHTTG